MDSGLLGSLLVDAGCVPRSTIDEMLGRAAFVGGERVFSDLVALVVEHEAAVCQLLAERNQAPALVLSTSSLDLRAMQLLPREFITEHLVLPVLSDGNTLTVAAPHDGLPGLVSTIEVATGHRVVVLGALEPLLAAATYACFAALSRGETVLVGRRSPSQQPSLAIARAVIRARLQRADSVAIALGAMLDEALGSNLPKELTPPMAAIGAMRLKQIPAPQAPPRPPAPPFQAPRTVARPLCVVIDDDEAIRNLVARVLAHDGFEIVTAADGQKAGEVLQARRPDLIVLDAMLPHVHGFEICASIKRSPSWASVPVIMISAVFKGFESARSIQEVHGADAFLEKPFEIQHLRHLAADLVKRPQPAQPTSPEQSLNAGRALVLIEQHLAAGAVEEAGALIDSWLSADPFSAQAWLERGNFALKANDDVAALYAYERASIYDGTLFVAHISLAMMYERLGFIRRSRVTWEKAAAAAPDPAVAARIRAQL